MARASGGKTHFLDLQDITGDDFGGLNLLEGAVTEDDGLESERLLQLLDDGTSLELLDETNAGVEQEQRANDTEIDPILETSGKDGGSLADRKRLARPELESKKRGWSMTSGMESSRRVVCDAGRVVVCWLGAAVVPAQRALLPATIGTPRFRTNSGAQAAGPCRINRPRHNEASQCGEPIAGGPPELVWSW